MTGTCSCASGPKHVDVDRDTVTQLDGDVLLEHDVDRYRPELRRDLKARLQGSGTGIETGQQAGPRGRQRAGRHKCHLLFIASHGQSLSVRVGSPVRDWRIRPDSDARYGSYLIGQGYTAAVRSATCLKCAAPRVRPGRFVDATKC